MLRVARHGAAECGAAAIRAEDDTLDGDLLCLRWVCAGEERECVGAGHSSKRPELDDHEALGRGGRRVHAVAPATDADDLAVGAGVERECADVAVLRGDDSRTGNRARAGFDVHLGRNSRERLRLGHGLRRSDNGVLRLLGPVHDRDGTTDEVGASECDDGDEPGNDADDLDPAPVTPELLPLVLAERREGANRHCVELHVLPFRFVGGCRVRCAGLS